MILTKKVKHNFNFDVQLAAAEQVANFAINNRRSLSSKNVKAFGLKSAISNQILRKYGRNKKCKQITKVNLIVPNQSIKIKDSIIFIRCLDIEIDGNYLPDFEKINQIEIDKHYFYISITVKDGIEFEPQSILGVDMNATKHIAVCSDINTGKVLKLGKIAQHIRRKYRGKKKESRCMNDLDHKVSRKIVDFAKNNKCSIAIEDLKNIRKQKSKGKKMNRILHSWSFARLRAYIVYKAKLAGVPVILVEPHYTSQECSRCGVIGSRDKKQFSCSCGHVDHADANAAFNIGQLAIDRDIVKRATGGPPKNPYVLV